MGQFQQMGRSIGWIVLLALLWVVAMALPALAVQCQSIAGQEVCLLSLRRSAKHYWEYRAQLSINGVKQPVREYDCRVFAKDRFPQIPAELSADTVKVESVGSFVCRLYRP